MRTRGFPLLALASASLLFSQNASRVATRTVRAGASAIGAQPDRHLPLPVGVATLHPSFSAAPNSSGFKINVTYQADVPAAAQTAFNAVVAAYESAFSTNITVNIEVTFGNTGLGQSDTQQIEVSYAAWRAALLANAQANPGNTYAVAAAASLPVTDPIGQGHLFVNTANARALGLSAAVSRDSTLTFSNSVVWEYTGVAVPNAEDFMDCAAHELDEALGIGSALTGLADNAPIPADGYEPEDYFRYSASATRAITTNPSATVYFSYDGGNTNVAQFNQAYAALGDTDLDRNDWIYGDFSCPATVVHVQDAIQCDGQAVAIASAPETTVLSALGYNPAAPSDTFFTTEVSVGSGLDYMAFPDGNLFGYFGFLQGSANTSNAWLYHVDLGYEYVAVGGTSGTLYFYDLATGHWWYSSSTLFPYLYDFTLNAWIYYFPNTQSPGHYTANPRYFANLTTGLIFSM
jgi:hypothetical protein